MITFQILYHDASLFITDCYLLISMNWFAYHVNKLKKSIASLLAIPVILYWSSDYFIFISASKKLSISASLSVGKTKSRKTKEANYRAIHEDFNHFGD